MHKILKKHDVVEYDPMGDQFDPNKHEALFVIPQTGDLENNTVGKVMKTGWKIKERVLRSAKVGVIKKS